MSVSDACFSVFIVEFTEEGISSLVLPQEWCVQSNILALCDRKPLRAHSKKMKKYRKGDCSCNIQNSNPWPASKSFASSPFPCFHSKLFSCHKACAFGIIIALASSEKQAVYKSQADPAQSLTRQLQGNYTTVNLLLQLSKV